VRDIGTAAVARNASQTSARDSVEVSEQPLTCSNRRTR
jgi:hypothetical protein